MALQGTLETFSIPDVLQLLSSTKKTGCLKLSGDRGSGSVWVKDGGIVAGDVASAPHADGAVDVIFELLRFVDGEFVFEDGEESDDAGSPAGVDETLEAAEKQLEEWKSIEAVVPSGAHHVALAAEISGEGVTISADRWKAVVAVAGGTSVDALGDRLSLGELPVARLVKELTEQGLVEVGEPRETEVTEPEPEPEATADESPSLQAVPEPSDQGAGGREPFDPGGLVVEEVDVVAGADESEEAADGSDADDVTEPLGVMDVAEGDAEVVPEPGEAAEIARQLANLSPKAARAVAAAAKATTDEERDAALAEVEASDDKINRDLLLKFLGTVN